MVVGFVRSVFARVSEDSADEVSDVLVGERVEDVLAVAAARDEVLCAQDAEALRDGRELFACEGGDLGHAELSL